MPYFRIVKAKKNLNIGDLIEIIITVIKKKNNAPVSTLTNFKNAL